MSNRTLTRVGIVALLASIAACADSNAPAGTVSDAMLTADAATDAGQAAALDVTQMGASEADAGVPSAVAPQSSAGSCTYSSSTGRFTCPTVTTTEGLTLDRSYAYFAGGRTQPSYDAAATDSINFQWTLGGTLTGAAGTAWLDHERSLTVSGLAGTETQRSWSGLGTRTDSALVTGDRGTRKTRIVASSSVDKVVFRLPRSTYPYPQSGTITHDVAITSTLDGGSGSTSRSATRHVVVTFDGTRTASMVVGTTQCTLDLVTRAVSCAK